MSLNAQQQQILDSIYLGKNILLTGPAGTGKSYLIKSFYDNCPKNINVALTSTTGISAIQIGGTTLHSYLGLKLGNMDLGQLINKIKSSAFLRERWTSLNTLIIDEISMLNPDLFDKIEAAARFIRGSKSPFGGIQLILTGDFLQLPVVRQDKFCFEAESWDSCNIDVCYLTTIIRQDDIAFKQCLNELRVCKMSENTINTLKSCIDKDLTNDKGIKPTRLYSTNIAVDELNIKEMKKLKQKIYKYDMDIEIHNNKKKHRIDFFKKNSKIDNSLLLCKGAQVMLLYNLDIQSGLANGSRGVVIDFIEDIPEVLFMNGLKRIIDYKDWDIEEDNKAVATVYQIPLKLAYATTIHSSQGMTLDLVEVSLKNIFEYGQAYVALSRVKTLEGLKIVNFCTKKIMAHPKALKFYEDIQEY